VPIRERPARLERLFEFSNLGQFQNRLAGALSGGMKQKLGLCCALIHQPEVLLLDEPTFGVDPVSRRDLWLIIHEMVSGGTTVVVSTAYMDEAERFDRVALVHRGKLQAVDTPDALQEHMHGEILIVRVDNVQKARTIIGGISGVLGASVFGEALHVNVGAAVEMEPVIASRLSDAGFAVRDIRPGVPGMEDVFIEHMSRADGGRNE